MMAGPMLTTGTWRGHRSLWTWHQLCLWQAVSKMEVKFFHLALHLYPFQLPFERILKSAYEFLFCFGAQIVKFYLSVTVRVLFASLMVQRSYRDHVNFKELQFTIKGYLNVYLFNVFILDVDPEIFPSLWYSKSRLFLTRWVFSGHILAV